MAEGVPIGLGSHVHWDRKIDARIAQALMSINAVKAVSIGEGWAAISRRGSEFQDVIEPVTDPDNPWQRNTNRSGGTEGGMTTGMPVIARFAIKPIATLRNPLPSVDLDTGNPCRRTSSVPTFARCPLPESLARRWLRWCWLTRSWKSSAATPSLRPAATTKVT